eukprot:CAMPEP_0171106172 /NCGR_PEP_ID=MMETSP0766_2-20121228/64193_1 /TAXON_ID=439317 /ORGANISM="Gambierdiscus australes, Strain CAWD 149" /LENGTH=218 /DNA_ID=CAMNT_0011567199 /DNA_START=41 /DNA_END=694 /DNA_ORIENTATION=-
MAFILAHEVFLGATFAGVGYALGHYGGKRARQLEPVAAAALEEVKALEREVKSLKRTAEESATALREELHMQAGQLAEAVQELHGKTQELDTLGKASATHVAAWVQHVLPEVLERSQRCTEAAADQAKLELHQAKLEFEQRLDSRANQLAQLQGQCGRESEVDNQLKQLSTQVNEHTKELQSSDGLLLDIQSKLSSLGTCIDSANERIRALELLELEW